MRRLAADTAAALPRPAAHRTAAPGLTRPPYMAAGQLNPADGSFSPGKERLAARWLPRAAPSVASTPASSWTRPFPGRRVLCLVGDESLVGRTTAAKATSGTDLVEAGRGRDEAIAPGTLATVTPTAAGRMPNCAKLAPDGRWPMALRAFLRLEASGRRDAATLQRQRVGFRPGPAKGK